MVEHISQQDWNGNRMFIDLPTGITMSYVEMGDPFGKPLILQHGMTDNSRSWSLAAPFFAKAGYHVFITDLRGHGKSSQPDGFYTIITYATDIKAFLNAKGIDRAILIGHSLGSLTMQAFYLMFPQMCEKVVLEASAPVDADLRASFDKLFGKVRALAKAEGPEGHMPDAFFDTWYAVENPVPADFIAGMKQESRALPLRVWENVCGGVCASDLTSLYPSADAAVPLLIASGAKDTVLAGRGKKLQSMLASPTCAHIEFSEAGHNIHFEMPEEFATRVTNWLKA